MLTCCADIHWIGGDPARGEVYGYAAWSPCKAILVLRNPSDKSATFSANANRIFELPAGAPSRFAMRSPWQEDRIRPEITLEGARPSTVDLNPFEVLVLEDNNKK